MNSLPLLLLLHSRSVTQCTDQLRTKEKWLFTIFFLSLRRCCLRARTIPGITRVHFFLLSSHHHLPLHKVPNLIALFVLIDIAMKRKKTKNFPDVCEILAGITPWRALASLFFRLHKTFSLFIASASCLNIGRLSPAKIIATTGLWPLLSLRNFFIYIWHWPMNTEKHKKKWHVLFHCFTFVRERRKNALPRFPNAWRRVISSHRIRCFSFYYSHRWSGWFAAGFPPFT